MWQTFKGIIIFSVLGVVKHIISILTTFHKLILKDDCNRTWYIAALVHFETKSHSYQNIPLGSLCSAVEAARAVALLDPQGLVLAAAPTPAVSLPWEKVSGPWEAGPGPTAMTGEWDQTTFRTVLDQLCTSTNLCHDVLAVERLGFWFELGPCSTSCPTATCYWRGVQAVGERGDFMEVIKLFLTWIHSAAPEFVQMIVSAVLMSFHWTGLVSFPSVHSVQAL